MDFGDAFKELMAGKKITRKKWDNLEMFLFLNNGSTFVAQSEPYNRIFPEGTTVRYNAHIDFVTAQGFVVPWSAPQHDMLATDWEVVVD